MRGVLMVAVLLLVGSSPGVAQDGTARLRVTVTSGGVPVPDATVVAGDLTAITDDGGALLLSPAAGQLRISVSKTGFLDADAEVTVEAGASTTVTVELVPAPTVEEEVVVVASTRTGRRLEDQPTRVEVLGRDEIEEKMLMTPGDIVMMLNEMGGLRVQATSPSIGAASIRVQGMKGRYTRFLIDGLPLFGQQVGGLGLLQIPPMDLGQVEVIKGVASAFYGSGAMGGVVNLLSRRPRGEPSYDALFNVSTLGATDAVMFLSSATHEGWSSSLLAGGHGQVQNDRDDDGWADVAGYRRAIVRPRAFWDGGSGRSAFLTAGLTWEDRTGGTLEGRVLPAAGAAYREALETRRYDVGGTAQTLVARQFVLTARGSATWQQHGHTFGTSVERDRHTNIFGEVALRGMVGSSTWVAGLAYERDVFDPRDVRRFAYTFDVPGVFAQIDLQPASWLALSAGGRVDAHSEYGSFVSPRLSALLRRGDWTSRASVGGGFFPSTPLTEETEAAGLSRLTVPLPLAAERGTSASFDLTRAFGRSAVTATLFGSRIVDPLQVERGTSYTLVNQAAAATNSGMELLGTWRRGAYVATANYAFVRSREGSGAARQDAPLTPRHSAGLVGMWEADDAGRVGLELYYTGRQRLDENPYRDVSRPYLVVGLLVERRVAGVRLFVNGENLTNVRQTRWNSLLRPAPGADGRWTVDAWAPVDGRAVNGGVRIGY